MPNLPRNCSLYMTTREFHFQNRELTVTTRISTSLVAWVASRTQLPARLDASDSDMLRVIGVALLTQLADE
jgi:hypothetical protein